MEEMDRERKKGLEGGEREKRARAGEGESFNYFNKIYLKEQRKVILK